MLIFSLSQQNRQLSNQLDHGFPTEKTPTLPTLPPFCRAACLEQQIRLTASKLRLFHSGCSCLFQSKALFCIFNQGDCAGLASSAASSPLQAKGWLRRGSCWAQISLQVQQWMGSLSQCTENSFSGHHGWVNTRPSILPRSSEAFTKGDSPNIEK